MCGGPAPGVIVRQKPTAIPRTCSFAGSFRPTWTWFAAGTASSRSVDGDIVIDGGAAAFLGVMPSRAKIVAAVKERLRADAQR